MWKLYVLVWMPQDKRTCLLYQLKQRAYFEINHPLKFHTDIFFLLSVHSTVAAQSQTHYSVQLNARKLYCPFIYELFTKRCYCSYVSDYAKYVLPALCQWLEFHLWLRFILSFFCSSVTFQLLDYC